MDRGRQIWMAVMGGLATAALVLVVGSAAAQPMTDLREPRPAADVVIEPDAISATVGVGQQAQVVLTITNSGPSPVGFAISENNPITATDFLIVDHNKLKDPFAGHSYDTVGEYTFPHLSGGEMGQYRVVYMEPSWGDYANLNLSNLSDYVEAGGLAVINIAGNIGSAVDIDPAGTDYYRTVTHNYETILRPDHPYITGQPYGAGSLVASDFNSWGLTDHGWLTDYPAESQLVLTNWNGPSWLQYRYGSGQVILTTLTYGWGSRGAVGAPLTNLVDYALASSGMAWLDESAASGSVAVGTSEELVVTLDGSDLPPGTYRGRLLLTITDSYSKTVTVPVTMTVAEYGLSASSKDASLAAANPGDGLTYTLALTNLEAAAISAVVSDTIPAGTFYVADSATGGAAYNSAAKAIEWSGSLSGGTTHTITFQVEAWAPLVDGSVLLNHAVVKDLAHGISHRPHIATDVKAPIVSESYLTVDPQLAHPGEVLTYTIHIHNTGRADGVGTTLVDAIPDGVTYVPGSATGGATYNDVADRVEWSGTVTAGGSETLALQVTVDDVSRGVPIRNGATIDHPWAESIYVDARSGVLTGADILVMEDDDTWADYCDRYIQALDANGYTRYDVYPADELGVLTADTVRTYATMVWYAGERRGLSSASQSAIIDYLGGGGDLLLTGRSIAEHSTPSFLTETLHVDFVQDTPSGEKGVAGLPGRLLAGFSATLESYDPDVIEPADPLAVPIIEYSGVATGTAGVRFMDEKSRVVFLGFDLEALPEHADRAELLGRLMRWIRPTKAYLPLVVRRDD